MIEGDEEGQKNKEKKKEKGRKRKCVGTHEELQKEMVNVWVVKSRKLHFFCQNLAIKSYFYQKHFLRYYFTKQINEGTRLLVFHGKGVLFDNFA